MPRLDPARLPCRRAAIVTLALASLALAVGASAALGAPLGPGRAGSATGATAATADADATASGTRRRARCRRRHRGRAHVRGARAARSRACRRTARSRHSPPPRLAAQDLPVSAPEPTDAAQCTDADTPAEPAREAAVAAALLCLVNVLRHEEGLHALRHDRRLTAAARSHSEDMVAGRYFAHASPDGETTDDRRRAAGYGRSGECVAGDNLGWTAAPHHSARAILALWVGSPMHRANLLQPGFTRSGPWVTPGTPGGEAGATFALYFGSPPRCPR